MLCLQVKIILNFESAEMINVVLEYAFNFSTFAGPCALIDRISCMPMKLGRSS